MNFNVAVDLNAYGMTRARRLCLFALLTICAVPISLVSRSPFSEVDGQLFGLYEWLYDTDTDSDTDVDIISDAGFESDIDIRLSELNDDVTIVTAYFRIGSFAKGSIDRFHTPELYRQWMTAFALIDNPLVVFVDNPDDLEYFRAVRRQFPPGRTRFILLSRSRMWTFSNETLSRVAAIFQQRRYPKFYPNTVVPGYSSAQHAKYETLQMAIRQNLFRTRYFCWLDIGLFRDLASASHSPAYNYSYVSNKSSTIPPPPLPSGQHFSIYLPPRFLGVADNDSIAVCEVGTRIASLKPREIVFKNMVWIGGGFFIGRADVMYRWTVEYLNEVRWMLDKRLMSTDQQVIYAMLNAAHLGLRPNPRTQFKLYRSDGRHSNVSTWFYLAYLAREEGIKRAKQQQTMSLTTTRVVS